MGGERERRAGRPEVKSRAPPLEARRGDADVRAEAARACGRRRSSSASESSADRKTAPTVAFSSWWRGIYPVMRLVEKCEGPVSLIGGGSGGEDRMSEGKKGESGSGSRALVVRSSVDICCARASHSRLENANTMQGSKPLAITILTNCACVCREAGKGEGRGAKNVTFVVSPAHTCRGDERPFAAGSNATLKMSEVGCSAPPPPPPPPAPLAPPALPRRPPPAAVLAAAVADRTAMALENWSSRNADFSSTTM